jgi:hypothetical protein
MVCYRFDLHRKYLPYMHGLLSPASRNRIDRHLKKCDECGRRLQRLKETEGFLSQLPSFSAPNNLWPAIQAEVQTLIGKNNQSQFPWRRVAIIAVFGLISAVVGAVTYAKVIEREIPSLDAGSEKKEYVQVPIRSLNSNTEPHVTTVGYVREVRLDPDGDMVIKLVEDLRHSNPFVICEVLDAHSLPTPQIGSRVRVYGVSRFDNKADHMWQEVHPVFDIKVVK